MKNLKELWQINFTITSTGMQADTTSHTDLDKDTIHGIFHGYFFLIFLDHLMLIMTNIKGQPFAYMSQLTLVFWLLPMTTWSAALILPFAMCSLRMWPILIALDAIHVIHLLILETSVTFYRIIFWYTKICIYFEEQIMVWTYKQVIQASQTNYWWSYYPLLCVA